MRDMTENAYRKIVWGILLSGLNMNINNIQILPSFIGYALIAYGIWELVQISKQEYYQKELKTIVAIIALSVIGFIGGILIGYEMLLPQLCQVCFILIEIIFYADFLRETAHVLRDCNRIREADKLKKYRITCIKAGLVISIVRLVTAFIPLIGYLCQSLLLVWKIWLSIYVQNVAQYEINIQEEIDK